MKKTADSRRILARNMSYFLVSGAKQSRAGVPLTEIASSAAPPRNDEENMLSG
jgi:hypothetical protein